VLKLIQTLAAGAIDDLITPTSGRRPCVSESACGGDLVNRDSIIQPSVVSPSQRSLLFTTRSVMLLLLMMMRLKIWDSKYIGLKLYGVTSTPRNHSADAHALHKMAHCFSYISL